MRYAVVSDIHANLQAWKAVLLDIRSIGVDRIICLGDIVGYGPNPSEVLESVYTSIDHFTLGNHDAVVCDKLSASLFNETARELITWTRGRLNKDAANFLARLPLTLSGHSFRCSHAEFSEPAHFRYIIEPDDAVPSWDKFPEQLLFVGHTHSPRIFVLGPSGVPRKAPLQDFELEHEKRYVVNVGAVGQPRDGETRASYCIFDQDKRAVFFRRVPFDIDLYRAALKAADIPVLGSHFLEHDPRKLVQPLRAMLNFSPPDDSHMAAQDVEETRDIARLSRGLRHWRLLFLSLATTLGVILVCSLWAAHRQMTKATAIKGQGTSIPINGSLHPYDDNMLITPDKPVRAGRSIPGWQVELGNRYAQTASVESHDNEPCFVLSSEDPETSMGLRSPPYKVAAGQKFCAEGLFKLSPDFEGSITVVVAGTGTTARGRTVTEELVRRTPNLRRAGGWTGVKRTVTIPAVIDKVTFCVAGQFRGRVTIKAVKFSRKP